MKHKHAELIKAWADGAEIQQYMINLDEWADCTYNPSWNVNKTYRIKPEPKPDWIEKRTLFWNMAVNVVEYEGMGKEWLKDGKHYRAMGNFILTFDGETGDLKSAEVIK